MDGTVGYGNEEIHDKMICFSKIQRCNAERDRLITTLRNSQRQLITCIMKDNKVIIYVINAKYCNQVYEVFVENSASLSFTAKFPLQITLSSCIRNTLFMGCSNILRKLLNPFMYAHDQTS